MLASLLFTLSQLEALCQQIIWHKLYPLAKADAILCMVKDDNTGIMYAGGQSDRNPIIGPFNERYYRATLMKLFTDGDTLGIQYFNIPGKVMCMSIDPYGNIRANIKQEGWSSNYVQSLSITPEGLIYKYDTLRGIPLACMIGKDSSFVTVGSRGRTGYPGETSYYFQRITKEGVLEPWVEMNPGHPDCRANRIEQLPNGNYLISGYVGSRVASYEVRPNGTNPVFKQWYQTPDLSNLNAGHVGRLGQKNWMVGGEGGPNFVSTYDSLLNKRWLHKKIGVLYPPQGMKDGGVVYGFNPNSAPYNVFYKRAPDSTTTWYLNVDDSLQARGVIGSIIVNSYTYFEDQSAIFAGTINLGSAINDRDPFFMKVANVGIPITSLSKPKKGPLANETLAPWPNPTGGNLYLKQHFDKAEIHFYGINGKEMGSYKINFAQAIDISAYPTGIYLYRAVIDGKGYSGKVVRN